MSYVYPQSPISIDSRYLVLPQLLALTSKVAMNVSGQLSVWACVHTLVVSVCFIL